MSEIKLNVRDAKRELHTTIHASRVDPLVAALSADPETIEELQAALLRFLPADEQRDFFDSWRSGICEKPWDAGIAIIDLAGRVVAVQSTYDTVSPRAGVEVLHPKENERVVVPYHVADTWLFTSEVEHWRAVADPRWKARVAPVDARPVLYGKVVEFIAGECLALEPASLTEDQSYEAIKDIHARWLLTPRDDLHGRAPRDLLLDGHNHISLDNQDRCTHWSFLGSCPPGLGKQTCAYRFGGFGTNEIVLYYDLVRDLITDCWENRSERASADDVSCQDLNSPLPSGERGRGEGGERPAGSLADEVRRLEAVRDEWLQAPNFEDLHGRTPASVIERERARLPQGMSGAEAMIDHDCPLCQMLADSPAPMFWGLDGCNMDDDFAFSFEATLEEWEDKRRKDEEFQRKWDEEWKAKEARRAAGLDDKRPIWTSSFSDPSISESPTLVLFGIGAHLAELTQNLKDAGAAQDTIDQLNRDFGNLREATANPSSALIDPVVQRMCDTLAEVAERFPTLAEKCDDLHRQLSDFATRFADEPIVDEDMPF